MFCSFIDLTINRWFELLEINETVILSLMQVHYLDSRGHNISRIHIKSDSWKAAKKAQKTKGLLLKACLFDLELKETRS